MAVIDPPCRSSRSGCGGSVAAGPTIRRSAEHEPRRRQYAELPHVCPRRDRIRPASPPRRPRLSHRRRAIRALKRARRTVKRRSRLSTSILEADGYSPTEWQIVLARATTTRHQEHERTRKTRKTIAHAIIELRRRRAGVPDMSNRRLIRDQTPAPHWSPSWTQGARRVRHALAWQSAELGSVRSGVRVGEAL